jgi:hypothetical protein
VGVAGAGEEKVAIGGLEGWLEPRRRRGRRGPAVAGEGEAKILGGGKADLEGAADLGELVVGGGGRGRR